jgi:hypothetical protein
VPKKKKIDTFEQVTEQQVWDMIEFAKQMNKGALTPTLINSTLKDINMNPLAGEESGINRALLNPKYSEDALRAYSEFFEYTNMQYKRMLSYLSDMPSFDFTFVCTNTKDMSDYSSDRYKKDYRELVSFLDKFNVKKEFKKVMASLIRQDAFYCVLRMDDEKYTLQELPIDYCTITGRFYGGFLFDFDMTWFLSRAGVDIDMYPSVFKEYYNRIQKKQNGGYDPSVRIESRNGRWAYYVQTSPEDGLWCWKLNQEQAGQVPYFSGMFSDLVLAPLIRNLQKNKYIIEASKVILGTIPILKDSKSGNGKDQTAISPETTAKFLGLLRQGINEAINIGAAPFDNFEAIDFKSDKNNLQVDYNKNVAAASGINTKSIYTTERPNAIETRLSADVDEYLITKIYPYFAEFLEYYVNKKTKKYKFKFMFEGTEFSTNREDRMTNAIRLSEKGMFLPQKFAAAIGMSIIDMQRQLEMAKAENFLDILQLPPSVFTSSYKDGEENNGGRPKKSDSSLSDSGLNTRTAGSNIEKGGDE